MRYDPAREDGGWYYEKLLWVSGPEYKGPALIRGRQLDGPNELRFGSGPEPSADLRFPAGNTGVGSGGTAEGWRDFPSYTRIRASGCYAWQIDGFDFTQIIVFEVAP